MLTSLEVVELGGREIAVQAAKDLRALRRMPDPYIFWA